MTTIDYSSRDFDSIKTDLLTRATEVFPEWTARSSADFGILLVDLWAHFADVLNYYIDVAASEAFITTATQRESMLALASLFDYSPRLQTAATSTVVISGANIPAGTTVTIPVGTVFTAPATADREAIYFSSTTAGSATSASNASVTVAEGQIESLENLGNSTGLSNQTFTLYYSKVVGSSVKVYVYEGPLVSGEPSAVEYQYVDKLYNSASSDKVFSLKINATNELLIIFGNGVNGKIPTNGQTIKATYTRGVGVLGNIAVNAITEIIDSPSQYLSEITSSAATGGGDAESILSLKTSIPESFSSQNRAVSLSDYKSLVLQISGVAKGTAVYSSGTVTIHAVPYVDNYLTYGSGTIAVSQALRDDIILHYADKKMIGVTVAAASTITVTAVNVTAVIYVLPTYVASTVQTAVSLALDTLFEFDNVYLNQTLSLGEIYRKIMSVAGVDYATISLPSTTTVASGATALLKKGTYSLTTSGGVIG